MSIIERQKMIGNSITSDIVKNFSWFYNKEKISAF